MAKRYLGYGYTNAQGIAKLEYDENGDPLTHSYTGVGAGKINIVAESGTLQSEQYELLDALFYDEGIQSSYNQNWTNYNNVLTISRDTSGTLMKNETEGNGGYYIALSSFTFPSFAVEFNILTIENNCYISYDGITSRVRFDTKATAGDNVRLEYDNGTNNLYVNDELVDTSTTSTLRQVAFLVYSNAQLKYKEFKVYPI